MVKAHPQDPRPRNDRFLLHTLLQNKQAACQDIAQAAALLQTSGAKNHNDLRAEILVLGRQLPLALQQFIEHARQTLAAQLPPTTQHHFNALGFAQD